ncbi:AMP deaminase, partial [Trifolium medium]|nr:AMP deaminase [Trifolium medium]
VSSASVFESVEESDDDDIVDHTNGDVSGPIAADILRKEPEHETFTRLITTTIEAVAPWEKEVISDPSAPKPNPNPFFYAPEGKSDHYFKMQDGVVHVYPNID